MINLFNNDCLNTLTTLADNSIDLTVTSPPYDNLRTYEDNIQQWGFDKFQLIAKKLYRITKNGGVVVWVVSDETKNGSETGTSFKQALYFKECGFNLHDTMIWEKDTSAFPEQTRYGQVFEYMFVLSKGKPKTFNPISDRKNKYCGTQIHGTFRNMDGSVTKRSDKWNETIVSEYGNRFNVWQQPTEKQNKTGHPAVFPLQLAQDHIITWSNKNDTVLDPFLGSGTTGIASKLLERNFIGCEIDEKYFNIAKKRIDETKPKVDLW